MLFWILSVVLVLLVLVALLRPLLMKTITSAQDNQDSLSLNAYKSRLSELEQEQQSGLLTEAQAGMVKQDVEVALLNEMPEEIVTEEAVSESPKTNIRMAVLITLCFLAASFSIYYSLGTPDFEEKKKIAENQSDLPDVETMVAMLEQRLQEEPENINGWVMLSRSYMVMGRYDEAVTALEKLRALTGDESDILLRYAEALAMSNKGNFNGKPEELIQQVLETEPKNGTALWFAGVAAQQREDFQSANNYWQKLLPELENEPKALQRVQQLIQENSVRLGQVQEVVDKDSGAGGSSILVKVSVAEELQNKIDENDSLFLFAKATNGLPMPLAVARVNADVLPTEIELNDAMAMMPQTRLSNYEKVDVIARISKSGEAKARSGDFQGEQTNIEVTENKIIEIVINERVP